MEIEKKVVDYGMLRILSRYAIYVIFFKHYMRTIIRRRELFLRRRAVGSANYIPTRPHLPRRELLRCSGSTTGGINYNEFLHGNILDI